MRATSTVVALSSLLLAASVAAEPTTKDAAKDTAKKPSTAPAAGKSGSGKSSAAGGGKAAAGSSKAATSKPGAAKPGAASDGAAGASGEADAGGAGGPDPAATPATAPDTDLAAVKPEDMPTAVRMRRLEQKTQALKERAWQLKARVQMLKEQVLGGGVGAQAVVEHTNDMGASFRLTKLIYSLDGTQVFARTDDAAESLYKTKGFDVFAGPIAPGNHNLSAVATYRGHGYGVFEYLSKYTFTASGSQAFLAGEGKISKVDCRGYEKGGPTTPLEKRASIECKVTQVAPEKPAETAGAPGTPGVTPASLPASGAASPSPSSDAPAPASAPPSGSPQPAATQPASAPGKPQPGN